MKILLADDHSMIRQGIKILLKEAYPSAEIIEASNATELETFIKDDTLNLVISDLQMPGPLVVDIVKNLRANGNKIPIIILTMSAIEQSAVRVIRAGANAYITKDNAPEELIKAVEYVLQKKRYISVEIAELLADAYVGNDDKKPHENFSDREFQVFQLFAKGKNISEISTDLALSVNTVSTYKTRIMTKLNVTSNAEVIKYAYANGLV
ncbi:MAG: response regulator transcription factor [Pedobacter sp.]|nr:response regulator transcription factor [Chitinophagaceae bacterium]